MLVLRKNLEWTRNSVPTEEVGKELILRKRVEHNIVETKIFIHIISSLTNAGVSQWIQRFRTHLLH